MGGEIHTGKKNPCRRAGDDVVEIECYHHQMPRKMGSDCRALGSERRGLGSLRRTAPSSVLRSQIRFKVCCLPFLAAAILNQQKLESASYDPILLRIPGPPPIPTAFPACPSPTVVTMAHRDTERVCLWPPPLIGGPVCDAWSADMTRGKHLSHLTCLQSLCVQTGSAWPVP